ncbi:hypothetical protein ACSQ67_019427 [Phaseolus vulgaris]
MGLELVPDLLGKGFLVFSVAKILSKNCLVSVLVDHVFWCRVGRHAVQNSAATANVVESVIPSTDKTTAESQTLEVVDIIEKDNPNFEITPIMSTDFSTERVVVVATKSNVVSVEKNSSTNPSTTVSIEKISTTNSVASANKRVDEAATITMSPTSFAVDSLARMPSLESIDHLDESQQKVADVADLILDHATATS